MVIVNRACCKLHSCEGCYCCNYNRGIWQYFRRFVVVRWEESYWFHVSHQVVDRLELHNRDAQTFAQRLQRHCALHIDSNNLTPSLVSVPFYLVLPSIDRFVLKSSTKIKNTTIKLKMHAVLIFALSFAAVVPAATPPGFAPSSTGELTITYGNTLTVGGIDIPKSCMYLVYFNCIAALQLRILSGTATSHRWHSHAIIRELQHCNG